MDRKLGAQRGSKKWGSQNRRRKKTKMKNQKREREKGKSVCMKDILHTHTKGRHNSVYSHKGRIINYGTSTK